MSAGPVTQSESVIDAIRASRAGSKVHLKERLDHLPRLREVGVGDESNVGVDVTFSLLEGAPTFAGELSGELVVTCQRCMQPMRVLLDEPLEVVLVSSEADLAKDFGNYEPVLTDLQRFDLRWFIEEQALLAMPLVARHEDDVACDASAPEDGGLAEQASDAAPVEEIAPPAQKPFANLRDLLKRQ
jgi:uncharacterized protein